MVDQRSDRAVYRQLADELRAEILDGRYPENGRLPSEKTMEQAYGVSRNTVRLAMQILRAEGLVATEHGRGTFVRPSAPLYRLAADRYQVQVPDGPLAPEFPRPIVASASAAGLDPADTNGQIDAQEGAGADDLTEAVRVGAVVITLERQAEVEASDQVAALLRLPPGAPVLERRFRVVAHGSLQQRTISYLPLDLIQGTPLADPDRATHPDDAAWPGRSVGQFAALGVTVTEVRESVGARMPMADEAHVFEIPDGTPMLTITRTILAGDRPVEAAVDLVLPGDRAVVEYRVPVGR